MQIPFYSKNWKEPNGIALDIFGIKYQVTSLHLCNVIIKQVII
jgi:hypothetical protein